MKVPIFLEILNLGIWKSVFRLRSLLLYNFLFTHVLIQSFLFLDRLLIILTLAERSKGLVSLSWLLGSTISDLLLLLFGILHVGLRSRLLRDLFLMGSLLLVLRKVLPFFREGAF